MIKLLSNIFIRIMGQFRIRNKILIILLLAIILMLSSFAWIFLSQSKEIFNNIDNQAEMRLENLNRAFLHFEELTSNYSKMLSQNKEIQQELMFYQTKKVFERNKIQKIIQPIFQTIQVDYLLIYSTDKTVMLRGHSSLFNDKFDKDSELEQTLTKGTNKVFVKTHPKNGRVVMISYYPIYLNNILVGGCSIGYNIDVSFVRVLEHITNSRLLLSNQGKIIASTFGTATKPLKQNFDLKKDKQINHEILEIELKEKDKEKSQNLEYYASYLNIKAVNLDGLGLYLLADNIKLIDRLYSLQLISIIIALGIVGIVLIIGFVFAESIKVSINKVLAGFTKFSDGDLTIQLEKVTNDEMGDLSTTFNTLIEKIRLIIENVNHVGNEIALSAQKLFQGIELSTGSIEEMINSSKKVKEQTESQADSIDRTSSVINELFNLINRTTENVEIQSTSMSRSSSAVNEMSSSINSVSQMAAKADEISKKLTSVAENGSQLVSASVDSIHEIQKRSSQIGEMINIISGIAEQTNLLAMNAAIEAAHAGDYGKGFSVVADEIRKLAESSSKSANEIVNLIKDVTQRVDHSTTQAEKSREGLKEIIENVSHSSQLNTELFSSIEEQAKGASDISTAINELLELTQTIKSIALNEESQTKEIQVSFKELEKLTQHILTVTNDYVIQGASILKSMQDVKEITDNNKAISDKLLRLINKFKLDSSSTMLTQS